MMQFGSDRRRADRRLRAILFSNRFILGGAMICGIVIPMIIQALLIGEVSWLHPLEFSRLSLAGSVVTLTLAHITLRKIGILPLVNDKGLVLFAFTMIYGAVFCGLVTLHRPIAMDYFIMSFFGGIAWYFSMAVLRARHNYPRIAIVGNAVIDPALQGVNVEWVHLPSPNLFDRDVIGIVFDGQQVQTPEWERFFARAVMRNIPVYELSGLREQMIGRVRLNSRPELVFGQLLPSQPYLRIKRLIDLATVVPALLLAAPFICLVAILIRLESPGPAFFVQRRIGYQGRAFRCYKLRSMRADIAGPAYTTEDDPRITRIGKFIRKWRIDELPQLYNILKGEMSWIGPRPEAVPLSRDYQKEIPYYSYRHAVPPGLSGWAAVHQGNVALTKAVSVKLEYDFFYIKYFSIWLDMLIVLMTVRTVWTGFGSR